MKKKENKERKYLPTLADLIDNLTINQIKEIKFFDKKDVYAHEIEGICHDIDLIAREKDITLTSSLVRTIIVIAQLNLSIWEHKDKMQKASSEDYLGLLKIAHQLNGVRNTMKNKILEITGEKNIGKKRTNVETDDLKGWDIHVE